MPRQSKTSQLPNLQIVDDRPKQRGQYKHDYCCRCGIDFKDNKSDPTACRAWGTYYEHHIWTWSDDD